MHLIQEDIKLMRDRYDDALEMQGIPCNYQYPNMAQSNNQGESVVDSYSDLISTHVFFDGNPKVKTYRRYGWVVENDQDLPFLIHCSYNLPKLQRDSIFRIAGMFADIPERVFRVKEISYDLQCPDHAVAQVVPVYERDQITGRTETEVKMIYNKSNHFIQQSVDYRGDVYKDASTLPKKG